MIEKQIIEKIALTINDKSGDLLEKLEKESGRKIFWCSERGEVYQYLFSKGILQVIERHYSIRFHRPVRPPFVETYSYAYYPIHFTRLKILWRGEIIYSGQNKQPYIHFKEEGDVVEVWVHEHNTMYADNWKRVKLLTIRKGGD